MKDNGFWKGFGTGLLATVLGMILFVTVTFLNGKVDWNGMLQKDTLLGEKGQQKMEEIEGLINQYYLDEINSDTMMDAISSGIMAGLGDKYAAYYNKDDYATLQERNTGNYCGIGAYVSQNTTTGAIVIVQPMEGSPAQKAGLKAGDIIYTVDDEDVTGEDLSTVVAKMKGEEGTTVTLKVVRDGEKDYLDITVTRREIESKTVAAKMLDKKTGYIAVSAFEEVTKKQFHQALDELEKQGQKKLIIDLRDNGGGLLDTAVNMLDRMLPKGLLVYTKDKRGEGEKYYSTDEEYFDKPVVILVNENTASASEVFSGAMQDYEKAVLLGDTTFGKGIVQSVITLSDGTAVKLTTSKYYTPKGRNIHGSGLKPDVKVTSNDSVTKLKKSGIKVDNQIQAAFKYLNR